MLKVVGSLSRLFSESTEPYIQYRVAENLFCKAFNAENLSRTDCSADASKNRLGIGVKTFLEKNGETMQKVAEFNSEHYLFKDLSGVDKLIKVCELRNDRIETTKRIFDLDALMYHCVTRKEKGILVYETPMDPVRISRIKNIKERRNIIGFDDGVNEYSFNVTKSTLYKRFATTKTLLDFPVEILENPFDSLEMLLKRREEGLIFAPTKLDTHIFLPLYSVKQGEKYVAEKSGLNQWNASGRARADDEVYIQIPAWIHRDFPGFFPGRDEPFSLLLPNGKNMSAKVCQDGSKALMSNPNTDLGKWILRDVLNLREGELLTYGKLASVGLDSVVIYKTKDGIYDIDFARLGSYEEFSGKENEEESDDED
jgi:hypothetical protein